VSRGARDTVTAADSQPDYAFAGRARATSPEASGRVFLDGKSIGLRGDLVPGPLTTWEFPIAEAFSVGAATVR
jgi:hypothetical protein